MMQEENMDFNVQLTLEKHFENMTQVEEGIRQLHSLWELLRENLITRLQDSKSTFVHFSLHDCTHSKTVISAIEMFLGEERIRRLSATDTFMLLCCSYAHDYGMAITIDKVYGLLNSQELEDYVKKEYRNDGENKSEPIRLLNDMIQGKCEGIKLGDIYLALTIIIEDYLRPRHWKGVEFIEEDFKGLFSGRLKIRLIKNIIQICQLHNADTGEIITMERYAQGIVSDIYHPRFIAFMLRLGDLLDLDNSRFPEWFVENAFRKDSKIPDLSRLHYQKHEAITHLYIGPKRIQVIAHCHGENAEQVAFLVNQWLDMLDQECNYIIKQWSDIAPADFGRPPCLNKKAIYIQEDPGEEYISYNSSDHHLQMQMPQEKILSLLEGTNIYNDRYVGIRELLQNAVDASLLQMWYDITHNKYAYLIQKNQINDKIENDVKLSLADIPGEIFRFYDITIELIRDYVDKEIYVTVKDKGIGIGKEDQECMANIGGNKEKNKHIRELMNTMPNWLKPAGVFGIGLQSVFQLTDQIEFYTRRPNQPERKIVFCSVGKNKGRIEVKELHEGDNYVFYDNYMQGTNVKFAINRRKLLEQKEKFLYYDPQFDENDPFEAAFVEMSHVISTKLTENPFDYFNIKFQTMTRTEQGIEKQPIKRLVYSFFNPRLETERKIGRYRLSILPFLSAPCTGISKNGNSFSVDDANHSIYYYDSENYIFFRFNVIPCQRVSNGEAQGDGKRTLFRLPDPEERPLRIWYKFTEIAEIQGILKENAGETVSACSSLFGIQLIIFDSPANIYLNIDRNRLKEQKKINLDLIEKVQKTVFINFCQVLLQNGSDVRHKSSFIKQPEYAITILLLFYKFLDKELFSSFWKVMQREAKIREEAWLLTLGDTLLPVQYFAKKGNCFYLDYQLSFPIDVAKEGLEIIGQSQDLAGRESDRCAYLDDIEKQIPLRYFHIQAIRAVGMGKQGYHLYYEVVLKDKDICEHGNIHTSSADVGMQIDEIVRIIDYCKIFTLFSEGAKNVDYESLIKKVFKPDLNYEALIVTRRPRSFKFGTNIINALERNMDAFILSPFDKDTAKMLKIYVGSISETEDWVIDAVKRSVHFKKCVDYVQKFHYSCGEGGNPCRFSRDKIISDYTEFIKMFCTIVKKHFNWIEKILGRPDRKGMNDHG